MKIKKHNTNVLYNNVRISALNLSNTDRLGYDYSHLCDNPDNCPYVTVFDDKFLTDEILSSYKNGIIKKFLLAHGCYKEYLKNTSDYLKRIRQSSQTGVCYNLISRSFVWDKTEEGGSFWSNKSRIFSNYMLNENKEG